MTLPAYWASFAVATLAFACMPGPAILYMTSQTLAHGRRAGLHAALGIHLAAMYTSSPPAPGSPRCCTTRPISTLR